MSTDLEPSGNGNGAAGNLAELRRLVAQLDRLLVGGEPGLRGLNPDGTAGTVAPGELIESAWGNAVVAQLNWGNHAVNLEGGATGPIIAGSTYTPFSTTVPAFTPGDQLIRVDWQYFVAVAGSPAGGFVDVRLRHGGTNAILSAGAVYAPGGSVSGTYTVLLGPGTAFPMYLVLSATGADGQVYADPGSNRLTWSTFPY